MAINHVELFLKGKWIKAPALEVNGYRVVVTGKWLRIAEIEAEAWLEQELDDPSTLVHRVMDESHDLRADLFTFAQKLPATVPRYALPVEWDSIAAIRLTTFEEWWRKLPQETRKNVRRSAKRDVVIRLESVDDRIIRGIVAINDEARIRQGRRFSHFGEPFDKVKRDFLSFNTRSDLLCAYLGDELIGVLKITYCGPIGAIMKLQTKIVHYDEKAANALIAEALRRCSQKRTSFVTYGHYRYGNQRQTSLMDFKARHGFEEFLVPRYYVPLTVRGKLGIMLKAHHGLVGQLPPSLVRVGRALRAKWLESGRKSPV